MVSLPRGRHAPSALSPFGVESQQSAVVRKCTASPFLCLPELCAECEERPGERRRGYIHAPNSPCRGAARHTQLTSTCAFQGGQTPGSGPTDLLGLSLCPAGQEWLEQSDSQGASGHQGLWKATWEVCAPSVQGAWTGRVLGVLPPFLALCLCSWGTDNQQGCQSSPRGDIRTAGIGS